MPDIVYEYAPSGVATLYFSERLNLREHMERDHEAGTNGVSQAMMEVEHNLHHATGSYRHSHNVPPGLGHVFEARINADSTEGRGPMIVIGIFSDAGEAVMAVKGRGVQGVGDGEVYERKVFDTLEQWRNAKPENGRIDAGHRLVYGYRQDAGGTWGWGYADLRDDPKTQHPEYAEYLRLKKLFEETA